jgi:hypothetical protein
LQVVRNGPPYSAIGASKSSTVESLSFSNGCLNGRILVSVKAHALQKTPKLTKTQTDVQDIIPWSMRSTPAATEPSLVSNQDEVNQLIKGAETSKNYFRTYSFPSTHMRSPSFHPPGFPALIPPYLTRITHDRHFSFSVSESLTVHAPFASYRQVAAGSR